MATPRRIQSSPQWKSTAVVFAYDDTDGWYDHVCAPPRNGSTDTSPGSKARPPPRAP